MKTYLCHDLEYKTIVNFRAHGVDKKADERAQNAANEIQRNINVVSAVLGETNPYMDNLCSQANAMQDLINSSTEAAK